MSVADLQEAFPPLDSARVEPRHPDAWAKIAGEWRRATVILWFCGPGERVALLNWRPDPTGPQVEVAYRHDEAALRPRDSEVPPDQWRWTCTSDQARRLWPMRRYRPWPACPGCGAAVDSASYADAAHTALIVLPCGQRLRVVDGET